MQEISKLSRELTALVVDDEPMARSRMQRLLAEIAGVELIGVAVNGEDSLQQIADLSPDIVFMDIEMPVMNGIEAAHTIIEKISPTPAIIFCTAYEDFALEAYNTSAVAYLLKPVSVADIKKSIGLALRAGQNKLLEIDGAPQSPANLRISQAGSIRSLPIEDVIYIRSESKNSYAGLLAGNEVVLDFSLKDLEQEYATHFIRVHRNALVNIMQICGLIKAEDGGYSVELGSSAKRFDVSRRHLKQVRDVLR